MTIYIKNMVCDRCVRTVNKIFESNGIPVSKITLGEVEIKDKISDIQLTNIKSGLINEGFEILDDKNAKVIERIKSTVIEQIHHGKQQDKSINFSQLLENILLRDYSFLSNLFSVTEGITIEKYIILQKTERVKELLVYGEKSLSEIAFEMGYSSVAHLSSQFKKTTGLTPSNFRALTTYKRKGLDNIRLEII